MANISLLSLHGQNQSADIKGQLVRNTVSSLQCYTAGAHQVCRGEGRIEHCHAFSLRRPNLYLKPFPKQTMHRLFLANVMIYRLQRLNQRKC
jgi:hypothetical protein